MVQVLVLGAIDSQKTDGRRLRLGSALVQRLVAVLATELGRPVSRERLIEVVWSDSPPDGANNNLQVYISRLRTEWGRDAIETSPLGYALSSSVVLDAALFEDLIARARSTHVADALAIYEEALALWRGPAYGPFADEWWARPSAVRLEELRLSAMAERIVVLLATGDADRAVADSELLLPIDPLRESFVTMRMRALHQSGRSSDALRVAAAFRRRLGEQAGLSPSPELDVLERQILEHDPAAAQPSLARSLRGYVFGDLLAQGAHGAVYAATQPGLGRDVAIKVLRKNRADAPEFIRRFEAEAQFVARLEHPSIVPLYDYWREPGNAYLVFRLLRGGSLAERIARRVPMSINDVDLLVERVGDALNSAHAVGIVHRDVRAANVLYDDEGRPYLGDFGIAVADGTDDEAADDVAAFASMLVALVDEDSSVSSQRSLLRRAAAGEITSARELVTSWRSGRERVTPTPTPDRSRARLNRPAANPFVGLRVFNETDAAIFFGRERAIDDVAELASCTSFVTVTGPSGAGKSSVVRAGVIPKLRAQGYVVTTMTPGVRPMFSLGVALRRVATEVQLAAARDDPAALFALVAAAQPTALVVDQLEELWTQSVPDDRDHFVKLIDEAVATDNFRLVSTIRADFYDRPLGDRRLGPLVQKGTYALTTLTAGELEATISRPLATTGATAEAGLVAQIISDVGDQPAPLPLLQFALSALYDGRSANTLTLDAYRRIGGVVGAIASAADDVFAQLTPPQQEQCRELFAMLVTPGETSSDDTRRRATRGELDHIDDDLIDRLDQLRLLTFDRDPATGEPTVEIAHEALLAHWPRLRTWNDSQRDQLRARRALREDSAAWEGASHSSEHLYRPARLAASLERVGTARLSPRERSFLDASIEQRDREAQHERRRLRRTQTLLAATAALLILALGAGGLALTQKNRADSRSRAAVASSAQADVARMTAQSRADATHAPDRAALLAVEAYRRSPTQQAAAAVLSVLSQQPKGLVAELSAGSDQIIRVSYGASVIAARQGGDIAIWDATTYQLMRTIKDGGFRQNVITVSGDDHYVATVAAKPDRVVIYSVDDGSKRAELPAVPAASYVQFDPTDATRIAVTFLDGRVAIIRWPDNHIDVQIQAHQGLSAANFAPNGKLLVTTASDGTLVAWDAHTGAAVSQRLRVLPQSAGPAGALFYGSISPNGELMAAVAAGQVAKVFRIADGAVVTEIKLDCLPWAGTLFIDDAHIELQGCGGPDIYDVTTGKRTQSFVGASSGTVYGIAVNPARNTIAAAYGTKKLELWSLDGRPLGSSRVLPLPANFAPGPSLDDRVSLNADLTRLLVYDTNGAYLYDLTEPTPSPRLVQFPGPGQLWHAAFSRDGRSLYSVRVDAHFDQATNAVQTTTLVQTWDPVTLALRRSIAIPHAVNSFSVSTDMRFVAVNIGGLLSPPSLAVELYSVESGALVHRFDGLASLSTAPSFAFQYVDSLSFSPDSARLLMSSTTTTVLVDLTSFEQKWVGTQPTALFDSSGTRILAGATELGFSLLDATTLEPIVTGFSGRTGMRPSFNPDPAEPLMLTDASCSGVYNPLDPILGLEMWDTDTADDIGTTGWKMSCGFWYPNGKGFVGFSDRIEFWDLDPEEWIAAACRFAGRNLTQDEWRRYGPKDAYRATCQ